VFLGASLALMAVTALGAAGGRVLGQIIPPTLLQGAAALAFVAMGILIAREAARTTRSEMAPDVACEDPTGQEEKLSARPFCPQDWKAFGATFGLLFVAEMGDKTQLAVLSLAGKCTNPWPVFIGGGLALTAVTALGVAGGQGLSRLIPQRVLLWISAIAFALMGILIGLGIL
jgi:putative Ca2+/H+ antiporter (TMEM165/GDT1 family)